MYSSPGCPHCVRAEDLLHSKDVCFFVFFFFVFVVFDVFLLLFVCGGLYGFCILFIFEFVILPSSFLVCWTGRHSLNMICNVQ